MRDLLHILEKAGSRRRARRLLGALAFAPAAQAANPLELNFWLSGPRYDGRIGRLRGAGCRRSPRNSRRRKASFWNSALHITGYGQIHETAFRPWQSDNIPRRYCTGRRDAQRRQAAHRALLDHRGRRLCRLRPGRRMVRRRARPQLGLQPGLQGRAALSGACPAADVRPRASYFVLEMFSSPLGLPARSGMRGAASCFRPSRIGFAVSRSLAVRCVLRWVASRGDRPRRRIAGRTRRASSISTCCRCRGRRPIARRPPSAAIAAAPADPMRRRGRTPSWCTGCGRNMSAAFPNYCQRPAPRLDRNIVSSMLDLMPAPGLIFNEWDKHGTCSGLAARGLFRDHPQGARRGEDSRGISRTSDAEKTVTPGRGRGGLRQGQSGPEPPAIAVICDSSGGSAKCASA